MARFGPPTWSQIGTKMVPKSVPTAFGAPWGAHGPLWALSEPILDRFWVDFGSVLARYQADFGPRLATPGSILGRVYIDFWFVFLQVPSITFLAPCLLLRRCQSQSGQGWP